VRSRRRAGTAKYPLQDAVRAREPIVVRNSTRDRELHVRHELSHRQLDVLIAGGLINAFRQRRSA
jgi:hypothetical protein